MAVSLQAIQKDVSKSSRRTVVVSVILVSVAVHLIAGVVAAIYVVAKYLKPPETTFVAKKMVTLPPKIIDPKLSSAEFEAAAPRPQLDQKIASLRETDFALPDVPMMPVDQLVEFTPSTRISSEVSGMLDSLGNGSGASGGSGGDGQGDGMNFFGLNASGRSVLIIFDISSSVLNKAKKAGISIDAIREETLKLIDQLSINTTFTLFQFSRYYQPFSDKLLAPTQQNKEKARTWLHTKFRTNGSLPKSLSGTRIPDPGEDNGVIFVLKAAFSLKPDVIYFISDGSFQSAQYPSGVPWDDIDDMMDDVKKKSGTLPKLNFLGFKIKPNDYKKMRKIVRSTEGQIRKIE